MKEGDLVKYKCLNTGEDILGFVTDVMEEDTGWFVYEVVCTDPYDRGWYSDLQLEVINES